MTFSRAMMEAYSVPCAPETSASTGPGLLPRTTTTGIEVAASTPAAISRVPVAFCPGAAVAVPTGKLFFARTVVGDKAGRDKKHAMGGGFIGGGGKKKPGKKGGRKS